MSTSCRPFTSTWPTNCGSWGSFPRGKHTSAQNWHKAYEKAVNETVERIGQQLFCQKKKLGRPYPVCLRGAGYLDHAFPLPADDPQYRPPGPYQENWAGTLEDTTAAAEASRGPDVIVEEEIEMIYDSNHDPTAVCHQSEMSAAESLADILKSSATKTGDPEEPPSRRSASGGDSGNLSTDSEMKEVMGELSLSAPLAARLGPAPAALPNLAQQAAASTTSTTATSTTQGDLDKLRRPDGRSHRLNRAWRDTAEYERQKGEMEKRSRERTKRASSQAGRSDHKRRSRSRSRPRTKANSGGSLTTEEAPPEEKPVLRWIPGEKEEYPIHYAEDKMHSFVMWAERHNSTSAARRFERCGISSTTRWWYGR